MSYALGLTIMLLGIVCYCAETVLMLVARKKNVTIEFWAIAMFQRMTIGVFCVTRLLLFLLFLRAVVTWDGVDVGNGFFCFYSGWTVAMVDILVRALRTRGAPTQNAE